MTVPFLDLKAHNLSIKGAIDSAMSRVISRANFIQGEEVGLFEVPFGGAYHPANLVAVAVDQQGRRQAGDRELPRQARFGIVIDRQIFQAEAAIEGLDHAGVTVLADQDDLKHAFVEFRL